MSMRSIEMNSYEPKDIDVLKEEVGYVEFTQAIGYLSTWGVGSAAYPVVKLWFDPKQAEITATYWKPDGKIGYVIGAVWHEGHFGFHS